MKGQCSVRLHKVAPSSTCFRFFLRFLDELGKHVGQGNNGVFGFRDPVAGTEQIGHIVPIVQDSQARLDASMESATFCQPLTAPLSSTACVSARGTSKEREETPSHRFFMGDRQTKVPTCPIECDQLRMAHFNHCLIGDL